MRSTPIGLARIDDERPHVHARTEDENLSLLHRWATAIRGDGVDVNGDVPEVVVAPETVKSVAGAHQIGEEFRRAGCRSLILCFNVWNFPYLVWPLVNTVGRELPILSLSNNNGQLPGQCRTARHRRRAAPGRAAHPPDRRRRRRSRRPRQRCAPGYGPRRLQP